MVSDEEIKTIWDKIGNLNKASDGQALITGKLMQRVNALEALCASKK